MLQKIRSIYKNLDQLQILVNSLDSLPFAVCLTETWINEEYDTACLQLDGYQKIVTVSRGVKEIEEEELVNKYTINECQVLSLKFCYDNLKVFLTTINMKPNTSNENLSASLGNQVEKIFIPEDSMSVICGDFNINHDTVSSKLKTLQYDLLSFDLHYVENANCTRETETSNSCIDAVYSNVKNDLKVSPTTITDHYTHFFGFSETKLNHLRTTIDDD